MSDKKIDAQALRNQHPTQACTICGNTLNMIDERIAGLCNFHVKFAHKQDEMERFFKNESIRNRRHGYEM